MKPDFLILGAFKAGTTSLHQYFGQHPQVFMTTVKEPNYFAYDADNPIHRARPHDFPVRSWEEYVRQFAEAPPGSRRGEASPAYLHSSIAPQSIHARLPEAKLIVSLRAPVDRAYSHFQMAVRSGRAPSNILPVAPTEAMWFAASLYSNQLSRYFSLFGRDRVRVVLFEDVSRTPAEVMRHLFEFIGVDPSVTIDTSYGHNPGGVPRYPRVYRAMQALRRVPWLVDAAPMPLRRAFSHWRDKGLQRAPALPLDVRERWKAYYREDVLRTEELTGIDLRHWL